MESTSRILYTNWAGIEEQRERAADLGRRSQVYCHRSSDFVTDWTLRNEWNWNIFHSLLLLTRLYCSTFSRLMWLSIFYAKTSISETSSCTVRATRALASSLPRYRIFPVRNRRHGALNHIDRLVGTDQLSRPLNPLPSSVGCDYLSAKMHDSQPARAVRNKTMTGRNKSLASLRWRAGSTRGRGS